MHVVVDTVAVFKNDVLVNLNRRFSIGVEKQTQMMVVHQNILSTVILKNYKLYNGNVRLHLATPEICQARNL